MAARQERDHQPLHHVILSDDDAPDLLKGLTQHGRVRTCRQLFGSAHVCYSTKQGLWVHDPPRRVYLL
ncbi:hypothetical protein GCM10018965_033990 [Nonomuraea roseola]